MKSYITIYFNNIVNKQFSLEGEHEMNMFKLWLESSDNEVYFINKDGCQTMILRQNICYVDIEIN